MSDDRARIEAELAKVEKAIAAQEGLRGILPDEQIDDTLIALREKHATICAQLTGSGAIAQEPGAVAVGAGGVGVGRDLRNSVVVPGNYNSVIYIINQYFSRGGRSTDETSLRQQIANYLTWMIDRCGTVELRGIKREGQQVVQLDLETVYVPLAANTYGQIVQSIELDQVLGLGQHIVITGGPGCGKTTILLHIAWTLGIAIVTDNVALAQKKLGLKDILLEEIKATIDMIIHQANLFPEDALRQANFLLKEGQNFLLKDITKASRLAQYMFGIEDALCKLLKAALAKTKQLNKEKLIQKAPLYNNLIADLKEINLVAQEKKDSIPLPIFIPLGAYATYLRDLPPAADPQNRTLAAFISRYLIEKQSSFDLPNDFFQHLLRDGQAVILLLDGLDEVSDEAERILVRQAIEELMTGRDRLRAVVTCRTAAYKDRTALGKNFREVRVKPLEDKHIEALVRQAYIAIYRHDAVTCQKKKDELLQGIHKLEGERRRRLGEEADRLISSPLLVRMLLVVHYSERHLPEQRAELYMKATDAMLLPDYAPDEEIADRIGRLVGGSRELHRDLVQHLAFAMHSRGEMQGREIDEHGLRKLLTSDSSYAPLVDDFIALTRVRGTLLEERLGMYRFIHLAFQEYLVARYMAEITRGETSVEGIVAFLEAGPILDSWWREPSLLVAGYLSITSPQTAQTFLYRLARMDEKDDRNLGLSPDVQMAEAEVAATAILEWQASRADLRGDMARRIAQLFRDVDLMNQTKLSLRAAAGDVLARLGDLRFRPDAWSLPDEPLLGFVEIPAGPFLMGSDKTRDSLALGDELPQHEVTLPAYYIGHYPVTVAQFRAFVDDSGHKPERPDSLRGFPNHPVEWVSWDDALSYCKWLTEKLRAWERTPEPLSVVLRTGRESGGPWRVSLPSEAEWEKAARSTDGRIYPWGDKPHPNLANYDQAGIGSTSSVGCFPSGASPYGVEDLTGNVWEWTRSLVRDYPYPAEEKRRRQREDWGKSRDIPRALRGGAFLNNERDVRCASRKRYPYYRYELIGFRVVVSPF